MSRHRIVRTMDYSDEIEGYDDVYGHSVDDESCISPTDAQQWIYDRARGQQSISAFMANNRNIEEENEDELGEENGYANSRRDSETFQMPVLDDVEQAKLLSCIDEIRSVVGDTVSEKQIVEASMKYNYDVTKALDEILNISKTPPKEPTKRATSKEPIEKDFKATYLPGNLEKCGTVIDSGQNNPKNHSPPGKIGKMNKLSNLLKNNNVTPSATATTTKQKFVIPKVNFCTSAVSSQSSNNSKLSQLASKLDDSSVINAEKSSKGFKIPKLFKNSDLSSSPSSNLSPLELSLQKIKEAKKKTNQIDDVEENFDKLSLKIVEKCQTDYIINLTEAININSESITDSPSTKPSAREIRSRKRTIELSDIRRVLEDEVKTTLIFDESDSWATPTSFGRLLCLENTEQKIIVVEHEFHPKHKIKPFAFNTKSPDEILYEASKALQRKVLNNL